MKRSKSAIGSFVLAVLLVILLWTSLPSQSKGGKFGLQVQEFDSPPVTPTTAAQPVIRASNLILVEFFAGY
jgi:hypothetical protein